MTIQLVDLLFALCGVLFNISIIGVYNAQRLGKEKLIRFFGIVFLSLTLPLAVVYFFYIRQGRETRLLVYFVFIFLYILIEWLLDFVFKIDFRSKPVLHIPYIILFYIALIAFIVITFSFSQVWGWVVSILFWILLGSLIWYLWSDRKKKQVDR
jgi:hypothetical protein